MLRAFIAAFSSVIMLLLATSVNASLSEGLVFYLTFDNVTLQIRRLLMNLGMVLTRRFTRTPRL